MDNKLTTAVSVEQLRALAEKIREAKAGAVTEMKVAIQAHVQESRARTCILLLI